MKPSRESAGRPSNRLDFDSIKPSGADRVVPEGKICSNHSIAGSRFFVTNCDLRNVLASHYHNPAAMVAAHCDLSVSQTGFAMG